MKRALLLAVLLAGCPTFPPPPDRLDAGSSASARIPAICKAACDNLTRLGCVGRQGSPGYDETFGTSDDIPCAVVCADLEEAARQAPALSFQPACISRATTCREAVNCTP